LRLKSATLSCSSSDKEVVGGRVIDYDPTDDEPYVVLAPDGEEYKTTFNRLTRDRYGEIEVSDSGSTVQSAKESRRSRRSVGMKKGPPRLLNLDVSRRAKDGSKLNRKQLCADILSQFRDPEEKEEVARAIDRLPTSDLPVTLESIITKRDWFLEHDFKAAYGAEGAEILASYYRLYSAYGFGATVAIDDCDIAKFALALGSATAPQGTTGPVTPAVPRAPRAPIPIVEGSCRKLMGSLLVTCKPNTGSNTYTVTHGGSLLRKMSLLIASNCRLVPKQFALIKPYRLLKSS
jgi:hypothetical protein